MKSCVVLLKNPFNPSADREITVYRRKRKLSTLDPKWTETPYICSVNGAPILRAKWKTTIIGDLDIVTFTALPQGGGGGSNPFKIILMIAVAAFASWAAPAIAGALGVESAIGIGLIQGAIGFIGSMLISAIIPPPKPPSSSAMQSMAAPSPTYSIGAQGNQARLGQAIPVQYGRMIVYPDFAAQPYVQYVDNEQYLYELFCIGQGEYSIESINIEDTPIASFDSVTYEVYGPNTPVTLFPTNIVTSTEVVGQEALYNVPLGGFIINASGTTTKEIYIDMVVPYGLYYANDMGGLDARSITWVVETRQVDGAGAPLTAYVDSGTYSLSLATNTPQRLSYTIAGLPAARYQVRLTRTNVKMSDARGNDVINWAGLRCSLIESAVSSYGNVTMLAVKMKANNALNGQNNRKINVVSTRKVKSWSSSTGWATVATAQTSIVWALADACKNTDYGLKFPDIRINLLQLETIGATLTSRGDKFCGLFDSQIGFMEALTTIARAGRMMPIVQGGVINFIRDGLQTIHNAVFSSRNIVQNSFKMNYLIPAQESADAVEVEFFNEATWKYETILCQLSGGTADNPAKVKIFGVTSRTQAWREGMYVAAQNRYRRKVISFDTELEGNIPAYGDLIAVQHDMPSWGQAGDLVSKVGTAYNLSQDVVITAGTHYIAFRKRDGSMSGPYVATAGANARQVIVASALDFTPDTDMTRESTHWVFGAGEKYRQRAKVMSIRPTSGDRVSITCINEDDNVHSADGGTVPTDTTPVWNNQGNPTIPVVPVGTLLLNSTGTFDIPEVTASWQAANGALAYRVYSSVDNASWTEQGMVAGTTFKFNAFVGLVYVKVVPLNSITAGTPITNSITIAGAISVRNKVPSTLSATGFNGVLCAYVSWTPLSSTEQSNTATIEVWRSLAANTNPALATYIDSAPIASSQYTDNTAVAGTSYHYWLRVISKENIAGSFSTYVTAQANLVGVGDTDGTIGGGKTYRVAYSKTTLASLANTPTTISTSETGFPANDSWGTGTVWTATPPSLAAGESLYMTNGFADATTTVWNVPFLATLKVGALSAISADMGTITAGAITLNSSGYIKGGQTAYNTGEGFYLGYSGGAYVFSLRSGPSSGARLEINNDCIKVYDASNVLRVKLGNLA